MRFPEIGEIFADNYRIEKLLGSGGFSRVYKAMQLDLDRAVALKILQPPIHGVSTDQERDEKLQGVISRFKREARMVSKLKSPHTITMYAHGQTDDGQLFMSIEYVDGQTLSDLVKNDGALEADRVAKIMRQVLVSLYEAHQMNMLHRDIKPQNIMVYEHLGQSDQVKLLDFGIVKLINTESKRDQVDLTSDDTLVGTPRYMAPEYIRGEDLTSASDLYSLGLVMYELLVGERAIQADSSIQIIGKQLERESFYLPSQLSKLDPALRTIINGMLEKNTSLRYESADKILEDLEARDKDRHVAPPNAPRLANVPLPLPHDSTDRLTGAVTEKRTGPPEHNTPPANHAAPPVTMPSSSDGHESEDEAGFVEPWPATIEEDRIEDTSRGKRKLLVLGVLLLGAIFSIGTIVLLNLPDSSAKTDGTTSKEPVTISSTSATVSADPPSTAGALDPAAQKDGEPLAFDGSKEDESTTNTKEPAESDTLPSSEEAPPIKKKTPTTQAPSSSRKQGSSRKKVRPSTKDTSAKVKAATPTPSTTTKTTTSSTKTKSDPYKIIVPE